ncbi:Preprotein translocase secY subunit [Liberibacter crescens BT-1]|uniref:Protein translocase subunit SecY n=1 Tax=Liberibacter crescens (strain BT-1) TaxID=1215343 RepID=L0ETY5_LIBCB|nr:preprotein translocase subunit SecY [Liberibacter crescens]AGA64422.1 Preprotein translocase secY subunit [Liberibacter crescens BT-1]AMC12605.1 preprotein translocase subunit SecY [Liberibacter crescens]
MPSAVENLASNLSFSTFAKADDLKRRLLFTIVALLIYRLGTHIPLPGINPIAYTKAFQSKVGGIFGLFNMFSGGAVERMAIFSLGIMPYISSSIIVQLMSSLIPSLEILKKEGEQGRKIINQYTRYGAVVLGLVQAYGISIGLQSGNGIVVFPGGFFIFSTVLSLLGGTMFLMWLGEQISSRGVGNGISLIIFSGIVAGLPSAFINTLELGRVGSVSTFLIIGIFILAVFIIALIVFAERAQRRLLIQYPKRQVGNRIFQDNVSHLPLKLNSAGVIPAIFASSLLLLPATISGFVSAASMPDWLSRIISSLGHGHPLYMVLYGILIAFFSFFYTAIVFNPKDTADNLKKHGGFIPGIRPGERTVEYIDYVLTRITVLGAIYLVFVCIIPEVIVSHTGIPLALGGTSLLIVVSVILDTVAQIQGYLIAQQYEGLIKKSKLRSGKKRR